MEPKDLLLYLQELTMGPYSDPDESNSPCFPVKFCIHFSPLPYMLQAQPILFSLI